MRNYYAKKKSTLTTSILAAMLIAFLCLSVQVSNAQTFYRSVSATKLNITAVSSNAQSNREIKSEGSYLIKDGLLDDIYNMKLTLPTATVNNLIGNKKITFVQTRVMVLPIMGMVHFVGVLDIDGVKTTTSFQLGFFVNNDQSITFKGTKSLKLNDLAKDLPNEEFTLTIDFVLNNNQNQVAVLTAI
ncbi:MAG: hypothetical protein KAY27_01500 [Pedobacter sp.]|nr:hypothetical protein [Pedobacter sp.]